jgi:GT2 family glycosyltransferase
MKERLQKKLSLSTKLRLKRLVFAPASLVLRLVARAHDFAERLAARAEANGLDPRRAWDLKAPPRAPNVESLSASAFLRLARAAANRKNDGRRSENSQQFESEDGKTIKTSVVIPVFNEVEFTFQCLGSLLREIDFDETEVVVVNNASTDATCELLTYFADFVRVIDNDTNLGFVDACNQGAAAARGRYIVFLRSDTVVLHGWLEALVETIENNERAGAVGSMLLCPEGRVREAGAILWSNGEAFQYGRGKSSDDRRFVFAREVDFCSGASLLIRKDLFERLGGFDRRYAPSFYEDADLCMGVRASGFKVIYQPHSRVIQYEGTNAVADMRGRVERHQVVNGEKLRAVNQEKFYDKWRDTLAREHLPKDESNAERAANRKWATQVAIFDDRIPTPDRDAGSARMLFILRALGEWCHPVLITTGKSIWPEYEKLLWKEGVETASALEFRRLMKRRTFSAAVISRPEIAEALLKPIRRASPRTRIIFDTVDVHFVRFAREAELTGDPAARREAERYRRVETRLARAADLVWFTSSADEEAVGREVRGISSAIIPTIHEPHERGLSFDAREHLLFVGSFRHRPNADAVNFFAREILPLVKAAIPGVELLVVGNYAPPEFAEHAGVRVLGYVPDIDPLFARARVFVAPIRFGAGVKGKIGESLSYGLPVVTTTVGAEGMSLRDGQEALIADRPRDFADAVVRAYGDAELWKRLSDKGHAHVRKHFSPEVVGKVINDSIKEALGEKGEGGRRQEQEAVREHAPS